METRIISSSFNSFHIEHVKMLEDGKQKFDYLICGLQDTALDCPEKNRPIQPIVEGYIQFKGFTYVDETVPHATKQDLEDVLWSFNIGARNVGDEYEEKQLTDSENFEQLGIGLFDNKREHRFFSSGLRKEVQEKKNS